MFSCHVDRKSSTLFFKDNINVMFPLPGITFLSPMLFPGGSDSKASAHNAGDPGSIPWVGKIPWRRKWQPTPVLLPRKFHAWRSLVGYSSWGRKELDTTERLHFLCFIHLSSVLPSLGSIKYFIVFNSMIDFSALPLCIVF